MPTSEAIQRNWHFMHPHFRGMNQVPEATCSDLAVRDIVDAVHFAESAARVDQSRIYLVGASGGGMAALMMAARAPPDLGGSFSMGSHLGFISLA